MTVAVWEVRARSAEIVGDRATCSEALEAAGARCEWMAWPSPSAKHAAAPARDRQGRSARAGTSADGSTGLWRGRRFEAVVWPWFGRRDFGPLYSTRRAAALAAHHSSAQRRQRREQCGQRLGVVEGGRSILRFRAA